MLIAGGLYLETCEVPHWDAEFGSGGRAAAAVSLVSPGSKLHTYARASSSKGIRYLESLGIEVVTRSTSVGVAFSYFHPLSKPHMELDPSPLQKQPSIHISGDAVLKFGLIEGDAVVEAAAAVYDPQTSVDGKLFRSNGSNAGRLMLVMNEHELCEMAGSAVVTEAARWLIKQDHASGAVVKQGIRGATVFEVDGSEHHIPAYRTKAVFKIGSGDVFSAMFTHYWAEKSFSMCEAADLASRAVAQYCENRQLPVPFDAGRELLPTGGHLLGQVILAGASDGLGRRYVLEEARFQLRQLGVRVVCPPLDSSQDRPLSTAMASVLLIVDGLDRDREKIENYVFHSLLPLVILSERDADRIRFEFGSPRITVTDDFVSSLYLAAWLATSV